MSNLPLIYGTIIGLLIGLAICYFKQLKTAYENRGLISKGDTLLNSAKDFYASLPIKF